MKNNDKDDEVSWVEIFKHFQHLLFAWPILIVKLYLVYLLIKAFFEVVIFGE